MTTKKNAPGEAFHRVFAKAIVEGGRAPIDEWPDIPTDSRRIYAAAEEAFVGELLSNGLLGEVLKRQVAREEVIPRNLTVEIDGKPVPVDPESARIVIPSSPGTAVIGPADGAGGVDLSSDPATGPWGPMGTLGERLYGPKLLRDILEGALLFSRHERYEWRLLESVEAAIESGILPCVERRIVGDAVVFAVAGTWDGGPSSEPTVGEARPMTMSERLRIMREQRDHEKESKGEALRVRAIDIEARERRVREVEGAIVALIAAISGSRDYARDELARGELQTLIERFCGLAREHAAAASKLAAHGGHQVAEDLRLAKLTIQNVEKTLADERAVHKARVEALERALAAHGGAEDLRLAKVALGEAALARDGFAASLAARNREIEEFKRVPFYSRFRVLERIAASAIVGAGWQDALGGRTVAAHNFEELETLERALLQRETTGHRSEEDAIAHDRAAAYETLCRELGFYQQPEGQGGIELAPVAHVLGHVRDLEQEIAKAEEQKSLFVHALTFAAATLQHDTTDPKWTRIAAHSINAILRGES
jgi:hypothetical protein